MTDTPALTFDAATTAVVLVDMQNDFCESKGFYATVTDISGLQAAVEPCRRLLARARAAGATVVFTRLVHDADHGNVEQRHALKPKRWFSHGRRLVPGTWGVEIMDALAPLPGEIVVDKKRYSAFQGTTLEQDLRSRGVTTVLVAGVVTYCCVLSTAFGAFERDFDVVLVSDAAGSFFDSLGSATGEIVDLLLGQALPVDGIALTPRG